MSRLDDQRDIEAEGQRAAIYHANKRETVAAETLFPTLSFRLKAKEGSLGGGLQQRFNRPGGGSVWKYVPIVGADAPDEEA